MEKVVVIGSGCAGYTAALYAARANLAPLIIGGPQIGGQLTETTIVDNFPGFPEGIDGNELMENMKKQAVRFGATFQRGMVTNCERLPDGTFEIEAEGKKIKTITVIVATGATARWLGIPTELPYKGSGVHTCATCDGFFYREKEIIIVGGGDSASEEGNFLTKFASKVWLVHRRDELRASKIMQKRIFDNPKIEIIWDSEIAEIKGDGKFVTSVLLKNRKTDEITEKKVDGIFLAIGHVPNTAPFKGLLHMDDHGFLITDRNTKTNVPGIFACGDVQDTIYKQAITAAGSGCAAAMQVEKYLEDIKD